jgi:hypothetical protein
LRRGPGGSPPSLDVTSLHHHAARSSGNSNCPMTRGSGWGSGGAGLAVAKGASGEASTVTRNGGSAGGRWALSISTPPLGASTIRTGRGGLSVRYGTACQWPPGAFHRTSQGRAGGQTCKAYPAAQRAHSATGGRCGAPGRRRWRGLSHGKVCTACPGAVTHGRVCAAEEPSASPASEGNDSGALAKPGGRERGPARSRAARGEKSDREGGKKGGRRAS